MPSRTSRAENELVSHILLAVLSYFAEYEAKKIGRPSKFEKYRPQLKAMIEEDCSKAEMKRRTGLAYNTVRKYLRRIGKEQRGEEREATDT